MSYYLKYGKHVELRPEDDIPALFHMDDLIYVFSYKEHVNNVRKYMQYLYNRRNVKDKFIRGREFPLLMDMIKDRSYLNTSLIIRLVEWQYTDNDGFWIREEYPKLKDVIFICIATRDYIREHKHAKNPNK